MNEPLNIISLGAGVQSSTMALMAAHGEITPMPEFAVFADTQGEPKAVYTWLGWLEKQLPFPVHRVTRGSLAEDACRVRTAKVSGNNYTKHSIPSGILGVNGKKGMLMRQCTADHKINVIYQEYTRHRNKLPIKQWIGISLDEASRMKPAQRKWVTNYYPLVERGITRQGCLQWMRNKGYPEPPRSSCVYCPYHSNAEWANLKNNHPEDFAKAVQFEKNYQAAITQVTGIDGVPYLHKTMQPLETVDFNEPENRQINMFNNECEGICGV